MYFVNLPYDPTYTLIKKQHLQWENKVQLHLQLNIAKEKSSANLQLLKVKKF